jgi:hypothetical protein
VAKKSGGKGGGGQMAPIAVPFATCLAVTQRKAGGKDSFFIFKI